MKIIPFEKYTDKNGKLYQVLMTAISLTTEKEEIVVQQLYGNYVNISIPEDMFLRIFSKAGEKAAPAPAPAKKEVKNKPVPEKKKPVPVRHAAVPEKKAEPKREVPPVTVRPSPATVDIHDKNDSDAEQDPAVRNMLAFLDSDDFDEKYMIVEHMAQNDELNDTYIDNMAASIDLVIDDGPLDDRTKELLKCLGTRKRFESTRLRSE